MKFLLGMLPLILNIVAESGWAGRIRCDVRESVTDDRNRSVWVLVRISCTPLGIRQSHGETLSVRGRAVWRHVVWSQCYCGHSDCEDAGTGRERGHTHGGYWS